MSDIRPWLCGHSDRVTGLAQQASEADHSREASVPCGGGRAGIYSSGLEEASLARQWMIDDLSDQERAAIKTPEDPEAVLQLKMIFGAEFRLATPAEIAQTQASRGPEAPGPAAA